MEKDEKLLGTLQIGMSASTSNASSVINTYAQTGTVAFNQWSNPERIKVIEVGESIEMIYKQTSMIYNSGGFNNRPNERIFKIVFSCVDGKWNKSEPIFGKIVPAAEETYEF
jgi:hypothetical protein